MLEIIVKVCSQELEFAIQKKIVLLAPGLQLPHLFSVGLLVVGDYPCISSLDDLVVEMFSYAVVGELCLQERD